MLNICNRTTLCYGVGSCATAALLILALTVLLYSAKQWQTVDACVIACWKM